VRSLPDGQWQPAATALTCGATGVKQASSQPLEYRVQATNKAGDGPQSHVVEVRG